MKHSGKYLANYAEPEARTVRELLCATANAGHWQYCLLIPAYKEQQAFYRRLASGLLKQNSVLLILVINQPDSLARPHPDNTGLWQAIVDATTERHCLNNAQVRDIPATNSAVLLLDRFSPGQQIPAKQGVGLARKIAADIALALIDSGHIGKPWIYTSDADAHLPVDYLSALDNINTKPNAKPSANSSGQPAAAIYPFKHRCDDSPVGRATQLYEQRMHQYVDGLRSAGSPYAFQTIGSTIAVSATHYAQVRGFPKRSGGEDFYLLNKLAKTGQILKLQAPEISLDARQSDRVPFGTGPAISKLLGEKNINAAKIFYHPEIFIELKTWLDVMADSQNQNLDDLPLSTCVKAALQAIGSPQAILAARKISTSAPGYSKHMHTWFDAFKTLKFIHYLQEHALPSVDLNKISCGLKLHISDANEALASINSPTSINR